MATLLQIEANRRNAAKSTGPTSLEGKQKVAQNARSHGVFSQALLLEGEDPAELAELRDGLLEEIQPRTMSERILLNRILSAAWRLRRLERAESFHHLEIANNQREQLRREGEYPGEREDLQSALACKRMRDFEKANDAITQKRRGWASAQICPGGLTLANDIVHGPSVVERFGLYEKRLEATLHRAWRELRQIRKDRQAKGEAFVGATPASPSWRGEEGDAGVAPTNETTVLPIVILQNKPNSDRSDAPTNTCHGRGDDADEWASPDHAPLPAKSTASSPAAGTTDRSARNHPQ